MAYWSNREDVLKEIVVKKSYSIAHITTALADITVAAATAGCTRGSKSSGKKTYGLVTVMVVMVFVVARENAADAIMTAPIQPQSAEFSKGAAVVIQHTAAHLLLSSTTSLLVYLRALHQLHDT